VRHVTVSATVRMYSMLFRVSLTFLVACGSAERASPTEVAEAVTETVATGIGEVVESVEAGPHYSPFVVDMHDEELPFERISFKDVGMSLPADEREMVYETIAEGLATQLRTTHASGVRHALEVTDPANHLACGGRHIYVDLWQAGEGWGYSLWSGCGEDDRFAHRELATLPRDELSPHLASLLPLTEDIATQLESAIESGCFTRHC